jgi:hypothetical protein
LADFFSSYYEPHKGKIFTHCEILGPGALALLNHTSLIGCDFIRCDLIAVKGAGVMTAAGFERCTWDGCKFINATIFLPQNIAESLLRGEGISSDGPMTIIGLNG